MMTHSDICLIAVNTLCAIACAESYIIELAYFLVFIVELNI